MRVHHVAISTTRLEHLVAFYVEKLGKLVRPLASLDQLAEMPYTFKEELVTAPAHGEFAANLTYPLERYVRYHHTSGTRGRPMLAGQQLSLI